MNDELSTLFNNAFEAMDQLQTALAMRECDQKNIEFGTRAAEQIEERISERIGSENLIGVWLELVRERENAFDERWRQELDAYRDA